jgi:hypothetical protein
MARGGFARVEIKAGKVVKNTNAAEFQVIY